MNSHLKNADKVSTIIIDSIVLIINILAFSKHGFEAGLKLAIPLFIVAILTTGFYFVNINSRIAAIIYALLIAMISLKDFLAPS